MNILKDSIVSAVGEKLKAIAVGDSVAIWLVCSVYGASELDSFTMSEYQELLADAVPMGNSLAINW
jgi:hypothetical protein